MKLSKSKAITVLLESLKWSLHVTPPSGAVACPKEDT